MTCAHQVTTLCQFRYAQPRGTPFKSRSHRHVCVDRCDRRTQDPWVFGTTASKLLVSVSMQHATKGRTKVRVCWLPRPTNYSTKFDRHEAQGLEAAISHFAILDMRRHRESHINRALTNNSVLRDAGGKLTNLEYVNQSQQLASQCVNSLRPSDAYMRR